jgi:hypothetical protein
MRQFGVQELAPVILDGKPSDSKAGARLDQELAREKFWNSTRHLQVKDYPRIKYAFGAGESPARVLHLTIQRPEGIRQSC